MSSSKAVPREASIGLMKVGNNGRAEGRVVGVPGEATAAAAVATLRPQRPRPDEGIDLNGFVALGPQLIEFVGIDDDVLGGGEFVAGDDVGLRDVSLSAQLRNRGIPSISLRGAANFIASQSKMRMPREIIGLILAIIVR